ncbi:MAG: ABC transporter permease [bacterium]|nr:ABC transporter permease [bacterium]
MASHLALALSWLRRLPTEVKVGGVIVLLIALAALLAPVIAPYDPYKLSILDALEPPSWSHWMGTDSVGRDVYSRVLYGTRSDLGLAIVVTFVGFVLGTLVGTLAAYFGGWADGLLSRVTDTAVAFPFIVVVLAVVALIGPGTIGVALGIVIVGWAVYARLARSETLTLREQEFVMATRALGYGHARIVLRHVLPNVVQSGLTYSTLDGISILVVIAAMSYLGFGAQPPAAGLGAIIASGQPYLLTAWWICTLPALILVVLGIGAGLAGDGFAGRSLKAARR